MKIQSLGILPAADANPKLVHYQGLVEASAAVALDDIHFVVASDEINTLNVYRRGGAKPVRTVECEDFLGEESSDIEAAARIGERIYWMSSHSRSSDDASAAGRSILFASEIVATPDGPTIEPVGSPYVDLREPMAKAAGVKVDDIDIEGLAATPEGQLLIGFRAPLGKKDRALLLPLENPAEITERGAEPRFGALQVLDLKGRGIRSIDSTGLLPARYLIIAGPSGKRGKKFVLYSWNGGKDKPKRLPSKLPRNFTAEALITYPEKGLVQVLSDDGKLKRDGTLPPKKRRFRSIDLSY